MAITGRYKISPCHIFYNLERLTVGSSHDAVLTDYDVQYLKNHFWTVYSMFAIYIWEASIYDTD